jgi:hypothetical protein
MLLVYVVLPILFLFVLHLVDSLQAYAFSRQTRDKLLNALGEKLSATQVNEMIKISPSGIAGTTRSIFTYGLLVVLTAAVFHLLVFSPHVDASKNADKILTVLAGALSAVIGFYFGSKATSEGVVSGAVQRAEAPARSTGRIVSIEPSQASEGEEITITGSGFGDAGTVQFGGTSAPRAKSWKPSVIVVKVPSGVPKGPVGVAVNPDQGTRIDATDATFEVI